MKMQNASMIIMTFESRIYYTGSDPKSPRLKKKNVRPEKAPTKEFDTLHNSSKKFSVMRLYKNCRHGSLLCNVEKVPLPMKHFFNLKHIHVEEFRATSGLLGGLGEKIKGILGKSLKRDFARMDWKLCHNIKVGMFAAFRQFLRASCRVVIF